MTSPLASVRVPVVPEAIDGYIVSALLELAWLRPMLWPVSCVETAWKSYAPDAPTFENVMFSLKRWSVSVETPAPLVNSHVQASAPEQADLSLDARERQAECHGEGRRCLGVVGDGAQDAEPIR